MLRIVIIIRTSYNWYYNSNSLADNNSVLNAMFHEEERK